MQAVLVNRYARIVKGTLNGHGGNVVGYDSMEDKVDIRIDVDTLITTKSDNIEQEVGSVIKTCPCGCLYPVKETENDGMNRCHHCNGWY